MKGTPILGHIMHAYCRLTATFDDDDDDVDSPRPTHPAPLLRTGLSDPMDALERPAVQLQNANRRVWRCVCRALV